MYRAIVQRKVGQTFDQLSRGHPEALIDQLADPFRYEFVGTHALGGVRTTKAAMRAWFERLDRLFDGLTFTPVHVAVKGMPWNTVVLTEVRLTGRLAGEPYENLFFQRIGLSMGKITEILTLEDTQHLQQQLDAAASRGLDEATASPITDELAI